MLLNGLCHIEKIIVSLPLSNLFLPNSNLFPLNSKIAETQWSKNQFSLPMKDRHKNTFTRYVFLCI